MSNFRPTKIKFELRLAPQVVTSRCACGWYRRNLLLDDARRLFAEHRERKHG